MTEVNNKLRILALHGYRQSDVVFKNKIGSLRKSFKRATEFVFVRAPHHVPPRDPDSIDDTAEEYGWWFNNEQLEFKATEYSDNAVGFDESVAVVETAFKEQGPFDGILGFSQGAAFVGILCAIQQKQLSTISFNFAILISGFKSRCQSHSKFYNEVVNVPSLHIYGTTDQIVPLAMTEDMATVFLNPTVVTHVGGHYVPGKKELYKTFIDDMIRKRDAN